MSIPRRVFVVDDDPDLCDSVCTLVSSLGYQAESFPSAEAFLDSGRWQERGVVVADLRMSGMSGIELQEELTRRDACLPVVILTAYARTSATVKAMKKGALTLIDKPYVEDDLWEAIREGFAVEEAKWPERERRRQLAARLAALEPDERLVMDLVVAGNQNKSIAHQLGLSVRSVEKRRQRVLAKMHARSLAELISLALELKQGR